MNDPASKGTDSSGNCALCTNAGGDVVWSNSLARVVNVGDKDHPGFCRVILRRHVREMTDLAESERNEMMTVVFAVERVQRKLLSPDKINLASLGNMVAHLHWHVIPRFDSDPHYPNPVWASKTKGSPSILPDDYWPQFVWELSALLGPSQKS